MSNHVATKHRDRSILLHIGNMTKALAKEYTAPNEENLVLATSGTSSKLKSGRVRGGSRKVCCVGCRPV